MAKVLIVVFAVLVVAGLVAWTYIRLHRCTECGTYGSMKNTGKTQKVDAYPHPCQVWSCGKCGASRLVNGIRNADSG